MIFIAIRVQLFTLIANRLKTPSGPKTAWSAKAQSELDW
jgi:hypothetical protein